MSNQPRSNISPLPLMPSSVVSKDFSGAVKVATPDLIIDPLSIGTEGLQRLLIWENVGGQEILSLARHDLVNGQRVSYSPIKNLGTIQSRFNSQNIISVTNTLATLFENYSIKFEEKLPLPGFNNDGDFLINLGTGPAGEYVYRDPDVGGIVINVRNMENDEQVEVQIMTSLKEFSGTIY
jgi:hypothetical protein